MRGVGDKDLEEVGIDKTVLAFTALIAATGADLLKRLPHPRA